MVLSALGLKSVQSHDKYLGIPTIIGRKKPKNFEEINEFGSGFKGGVSLPFLSMG